jgi:hypothetical protein
MIKSAIAGTQLLDRNQDLQKPDRGCLRREREFESAFVHRGAANHRSLSSGLADYTYRLVSLQKGDGLPCGRLAAIRSINSPR